MSSFDYEGIISKLSNCCLTESSCGSCEKEDCLIGYSKQCLVKCLKEQEEYIENGMEYMPQESSKIYDEDSVAQTIGFLLNQCKNCNLYHDEECLINIIRSSLEIILLGEAQEYLGSTLMYMNDVKNINKDVAQKIFKHFQDYKK
ncbi:hypothetical protein SAMN05661008_00036 [Alkalithermobacter thermoalcaliphilus JW-YL-7 = DSM 7308]|uniref:Uncharacterized protein n=1 Tax=Alkalithermobacter thermoalcaliphilus JW-YL-7 = DSM 7308 TaxID=1121328 RepID=A0A150FTP7_CLOPD|nr:hypothetical protein JWYL7_1485 [[Clostridium] paradoxum JW-YL-7 = DSM 7308]SHK33702.1 hypothetical protein SAMN05661008_00036 [[Clostridium] paradoxum JW-YL-7 = DSM 7308]